MLILVVTLVHERVIFLVVLSNNTTSSWIQPVSIRSSSISIKEIAAVVVVLHSVKTAIFRSYPLMATH